MAMTRMNEILVGKDRPHSLEGVTPLFEIKISTFVISAVYFLCLENKVVYVGLTKNLGQRISMHLTEKQKMFDQVFYIHTPVHLLKIIEGHCIDKLKPEYNKTWQHSFTDEELWDEDNPKLWVDDG